MTDIPIPDLDARDEDTVTAAAIAALPAELSDRNSSAVAVKLLEACGTYYGLLLNLLNQVPEKLYLVLLDLLGITIETATYATGVVKFTRAVAVDLKVVLAGTIVKTGTGTDAIEVETDADITLNIGVFDNSGPATAVEAGIDGNVPIDSLIYFDTPISGIDSVTNDAAFTGGQDEEPLASAIARAPLEMRSSDRAITQEDFEYQATEVADVARCLCVSEYGGQVRLYILAESDLNETPSGALNAAVVAYIESVTIPGLLIEVNQESVTLVQITDLEVELEDGYTTTDVEADIEEVLENYLTAVDVYDTDQSLIGSGWTYARDLTENDISSRVAQVTGIKRVGEVKCQTSANYGGAWAAEATLVTVTPPAVYGLIHYGGDYTPPKALTLVEI